MPVRAAALAEPPVAPTTDGPDPTGTNLVVGRGAELDALVAAVDEGRLGTGRLLVIEGAAGMGKSTLLGRLENSVKAIGGTVLRGSGVGAGTAPALWPWITIVRQLRAVEPDLTRELLEAPAADVLALLDPSARPDATVVHTDVALARTRLYRLLVDLLSAIRASRPLAVVIDDAHWLDRETVSLLDLVVDELVPQGVLIALALRPDEPTEGRDAVLSLASRVGGNARRLPLTGLTPDGVALIVRRLSAGDAAPEVSSALHERTGGNPFFIEELVALLISERRLDAEGVYTALPDGVRDVIRRRLDRLPEQTLTLLGVLALLGRGADLGLPRADRRLRGGLGSRRLRGGRAGRPARRRSRYGRFRAQPRPRPADPRGRAVDRTARPAACPNRSGAAGRAHHRR